MSAVAQDLQRVAASPHGMVTTAHSSASAAGAEMLEEGGNAVDAAVAAAFALGVCESQACGLGGQSMLLIHLAETRKTLALDGSSRAPSRAVAEHFQKLSTRLRGYQATTVPSTPAVLAYASQRYGTLPLARLLEPAIHLADQGVETSVLQNQLQQRELKHWLEGNAAALFLHQGREPYQVGSLFKQPALAATLRRLAKHGVEDFYQGQIARCIHDDMEKNEGLVHLDDLGLIPWPIERRPVSCRFEELRVLTSPPPAAGRTLVQMLNVLSHFPDKLRNPDSPEGAVLLAEVIRRSQLDRRDRPFDPNFYPQVEERHMVSTDYAKRVARQIKRRLSPAHKGAALGATDGRGRKLDEGSGETTHLSTMDRSGNVVGLTQSIERVYGALVATEELGFLYNNYMSAFEYSDYTHPYYLRPNGVPWASVVPTVVFRGRRPWAVLGSPGSERITSTVLQVLLRLRSQPPLSAVASPRLHCSASGKVSFEAAWMRDDIPEALQRHGFRLDRREPFAFYMGCAQIVVREGKTLVGVADPRRDGSAVGAKK